MSDENEEDAMSAYQESLELLDSATDKTGIRSKVLLNLIRFKSRSEDETVSPGELEEALSQITGQPDSHAKAEDLISLSLLVSDPESESSEFGTDLEQTDYPSGLTLLTKAKDIAESLGDTRTASHAYGYLGHLYETGGALCRRSPPDPAGRVPCPAFPRDSVSLAVADSPDIQGGRERGAVCSCLSLGHSRSGPCPPGVLHRIP